MNAINQDNPARRATSTGRYHTLDAMRGVAALLVAVYHFDGSLVPKGYLAVDFFFILSGFVISLSYEARIKSGMDTFEFMIARLIRLYPLYLFGEIIGSMRQVGGIVLKIPHGMTNADIAFATVLSWFLLPFPAIGQTMIGFDVLYPLNGPSWSLALEVCVNLLFAVLLVRIRSVWIAGISLAAFLVLTFRIGAPMYFNVGWAWQNLGSGIARVMFAFPLGMIFARHFPVEWRRRTWIAPIVVVILAVPLLSPAWLDFGNHYRVASELAVVAVAFPALLALGVICEAPVAFRRVFGMLGDISYAVYAIHWPLVKLVAILAARMHLGPVPATLLFAVIVSAGGYFANHLLDVPVRRWLTARWKQRQAIGPLALGGA